jgi:nucleotide-binding universal stress UspA family protein
MQSLARILLPVDFSERSAVAVRHARSLAAHFQSELILLHVLTTLQFEFGAIEIGGSRIEELYKDRSRSATRALKEFLAEDLADLNVRRVLLEGEPARGIVEFAESEHCGLILMPTHGYGTFRRFIIGSNTAKVLHDADCPVWTGVHLQAAPRHFGEVEHVLCGVDLGAQSAKALRWAAFLAREFAARLTLLHVTSCAPGQESTQDVHRAARVELERLLNVLVIGRGSAAGVFGRLRSNAYGIIRESACPVVSV